MGDTLAGDPESAAASGAEDPDRAGAVDADRYPLSDPYSTLWASAVACAREQLGEFGCAVLPGFVRAGWVDRLREEGARIAPEADHEVQTVNVYNTAVEDIDPRLPADHPACVRLERGNAFVARDHIPDDLVIHRLYRDPEFQRFLAACFGLPALHQLADPLAGLCLNVVTEGRWHPWHFDTNELAISLLTQAPAAGGVFEYCPDIRSPDAENPADVADVLAGRVEHLVRRIVLRPGDLQLFRGRYSLHRVTEVSGPTPRHSAIFSYSERPGVVGTEVRTRQLFGRVLPQHLSGGTPVVRVDKLMD